MPLSSKNVVQFNKGLITEAGELTFPEGASVDECNCVPERTGGRRRRLGIEYEDGYSLSSFSSTAANLFHTFSWENVGGEASLQYTGVQVGSTLYFYNKSLSPISGQEVPVSDADSTTYSIDLTAYETATGDTSQIEVEATSSKGALVIVSSAMSPIYLERDNSTGVFTISSITFRLRDFEWQGDRSTYDAEVATGSVSTGRKYDTQNTGWVGTKGDAALTTYKSANTAYPPLTHPWYSGKDATDDFDEAEWQKVYSGSTLIANGHYILSLFAMDRETASGVSGIGTAAEATRFKTAVAYAGRVFYAGLRSAKNSSNIFFSRLLDDISDCGECLQVNDPTSEEISDLLDSDGGVISIPEAHNLIRMESLGASLFVFAENGIWEIKGVDNVFKATEYSVNKITDVGLAVAGSLVKSDSSILWWSHSGIHNLSFSSESLGYVEQNISLSTIQTYYDEIGADSKSKVIAEYDAINKKVYWLYPETGETTTSKKNNFLILDLSLQAFFPWTIEDRTLNTPFIVGTSFFRGVGYGEVEHDVVDSSGNLVVDSSGNQVVATYSDVIFSGDSEVKFLVRDATNGSLTFATFSSLSFGDWGDADYSSYAEAAYDFHGDLTTRKTVPYITVYSKLTETGWEGNEVDGYTPTREGGLLLSAYWDFRTVSTSTPQQVYRFKYNPVVDPDALDTFGYPLDIISTKTRLRGRGKVLKLRFESQTGKDFNLLGYGIVRDTGGKV